MEKQIELVQLIANKASATVMREILQATTAAREVGGPRVGPTAMVFVAALSIGRALAPLAILLSKRMDGKTAGRMAGHIRQSGFSSCGEELTRDMVLFAALWAANMEDMTDEGKASVSTDDKAEGQINETEAMFFKLRGYHFAHTFPKGATV